MIYFVDLTLFTLQSIDRAWVYHWSTLMPLLINLIFLKTICACKTVGLLVRSHIWVVKKIFYCIFNNSVPIHLLSHKIVMLVPKKVIRVFFFGRQFEKDWFFLLATGRPAFWSVTYSNITVLIPFWLASISNV